MAHGSSVNSANVPPGFISKRILSATLVRLDYATLRLFKEGNDIINFLTLGHLLTHHLKAFLHEALFIINDAVGIVNVFNNFGGETAAAESHDVQTAISNGFTTCDYEGRNVLRSARTSAHHYIATDAAELVNKYSRTDDSVVVMLTPDGVPYKQKLAYDLIELGYERAELAEGKGMYNIKWSVDSIDWRENMTSENILNRVLGRIEPGGIMLFHNDTKYICKVLPTIIETLQKQEYKFVKVSELIYMEDYYIDNTGKQIKNS